MKAVLISMLIGVLAIFSACTHSDSQPAEGAHIDSAKATTEGEAKEYYTCPMHPSVRSDKPGACPVCGMALVKRSAMTQGTDAEIAGVRSVSLSPSQRVVANVSTTQALRGNLDKEITAVGAIGYAEPLQAKVAARFRGRIEKLHVSFTGEVVRKGQALFDLYSPDLVSAEQELILALNSSINATGGPDQDRLTQAARERLRVHFGLTPEQIAEVEQSKQVRSTLTYYSPIQGTVLDKSVQEGQYVEEGMLLYQLADLSTVWVSLDVYEKDARFVTLGQKVKIFTETYPNEAFAGKVTFVSPVIDPDTRTVRVRTELSNRDGRLKPQMYVRASFEVPGGRTIVIPASAVLSTGRRNVVWVEVKPNAFEPRTVDLGVRSGVLCEVLSGLAEGESVVTTGGFLLDSESQLQQPAGTSNEPAASQLARENSKPATESTHVVMIRVDEKYTPNIVRVKKGEHVQLSFNRVDDSECTNEVVIKEFNIHRALPAFQTTTIELTPKKKGQFRIECGMGMEQGTLTVE